MRTIATAGHVDHGKSTLVRALTGTDPDRLAEERARGLTIDLGYAFATLPSGRQIGFVDVPGHARFLPNMLAGAGAVDLVLFVVAADDGWCAQSQEHLRILDLLGAAGGVIALTKADRVDADRIAQVEDVVRARTQGTVLGGAAIVACDSVRDDGITALRATLDELLETMGPPLDRARPRLWVDRAFTVKGAGTVVTGTLEGGGLVTGQSVLVVGNGERPARIRGLESGGTAVDAVQPGARAAVNLVGIERAEVARGDVVVLPDQWSPTAVVDGRVRLEGGLPSSSTVLHVHVGSAKVQGHVRIVGGFARVRLERPLPLVPGDRLIVRDPGPRAIVGAIEVLDVDPPARIDTDRLQLPVVEQRFRGEPWQRRRDLAPMTGLDDEALDDELARLSNDGVVVAVGPWFVGAAEHERAATALVAAVSERALPVAEVGAAIGLSRDQTKALAVDVDEVVLEQNVVRHRDALTTAATPAGRAVLDALLATPFAPPDPRGVAGASGVLSALVREGAVTKCGAIWFATDALTDAAERVITALITTPELTVSDLRDLLGSSRKYTIEIVGWLDATGITRRQGDVRVRGAGAAPGAAVS